LESPWRAGTITCEIDANLKDAWGIPALRISMTHGDNEAALMEDAATQAAKCWSYGSKKTSKSRHASKAWHGKSMNLEQLAWSRPKKIGAHTVQSNSRRQDLFVMDGASFVSSACQNPTLTMMAITVRACANLIDRFRKNEV